MALDHPNKVRSRRNTADRNRRPWGIVQAWELLDAGVKSATAGFEIEQKGRGHGNV